MQEGYWVVRTYESGAVGEKTKFWILGSRPSKAGRKEKSEIKKQEQNEYAAVKQLARVINANFRKGDLLLGLDYSDEGIRKLDDYAADNPFEIDEADPESFRLEQRRLAAEREGKLCIRRVKRELLKQGIELKSVLITSDMDGDTGESVRVHHHLVVPEEAKEAFLKKWKLGGVSWTYMTEQIDYTPIAEYFLRQVRRIPDAKKYTTSRNLIRPQPKDRIVMTEAEVRVPKGGKLLYRGAYKAGQPQYIRYMLPREKWRRPDVQT